MWQAASEYSYTKENTWNRGGRRAQKWISDAEQLLVFLYPATTIRSLSIESIEDEQTDVIRALRRLGGGRAIPQVIMRGTKDYLLRYRDDEGNPTFVGGSYFQAPGEETEAVVRQRRLGGVGRYFMSVAPRPGGPGFGKVFKTTVTP